MPESILKMIEKRAARLTLREHIRLIEILTRQLAKKSVTLKQKLDWKELYGLGKGIWDDDDAQSYVNNSREDRI